MDFGLRQPVHTVYGGAHLFKSDIAPKLGARAREALAEHAPDASVFARAIGLTAETSFAETIYRRVSDKLQREPVEDFRIDFEDGFGVRSDEEEDVAARDAAKAAAAAMRAGQLPPFIGIRVKSFGSADSRRRGIRTLELFVKELAAAGAGKMPPHFAVTLPKITAARQVAELADVLDRLEASGPLARALAIEVMIETPQSIFDEAGRVAPPALVTAGRGRVVAAHFGTYDYTASLNITAACQHMTHPACDFARHVLQVSLAPTGVWLSDGATNILPVGPDAATVHRAWKLHYGHIRHSLEHAYYQGWDLHPAQLPTRYAAVYAFFLEGLDASAERLRNFITRAAQATLVGDVFDDAATGQGLLNYFLRAINCGAVSDQEVVEKTGLTLDELRTRSFVEIMKRRK